MVKTLRYLFVSMMMLVCGSAMAEDIIWQEDWSSVTEFKVDPANFNENYTFTGTVLNTDNSFKSGTTFYNEKLAGGVAPELLLAKSGGSFSAKVALNGKSGEMMLAFKANKNLTITADGATLGEATVTGNDYMYPVTVAAGSSEITITFKMEASSNARLDNIKLYQGTAKKPAGLTWGKNSASVTFGGDYSYIPTLQNENNLNVTCTSTNPEVCTVTNEGVITVVGVGKTTITATFAGNDEYEAQEVSVEVTVKEAQGEVKTVSVAESLALIEALENGATTTEVYQVKGYVVGAPDFQRNTEGVLYGNVNLTIADAQGGTPTLTVYRAKSFNGDSFTEETINTIKEGDLVVFEGKLQKYVKNENVTPELVSGKLISVNGQGSAGISNIEVDVQNAPVYNLAGQRVMNAQKGLFIIGGKKVIK